MRELFICDYQTPEYQFIVSFEEDNYGDKDWDYCYITVHLSPFV